MYIYIFHIGHTDGSKHSACSNGSQEASTHAHTLSMTCSTHCMSLMSLRAMAALQVGRVLTNADDVCKRMLTYAHCLSLRAAATLPLPYVERSLLLPL